MKNKGWNRYDTLLLLFAAVPIAISLFWYGKLPDRVATHFGEHGEANGYQSKINFFIMMVLLSVVLPMALKWFRRIDPRKESYKKFPGVFELMRFLLVFIMNIALLGTMMFNLGYHINISSILLVGIGMMFMVMGNFLGRIRTNYFMGIRTPWTLASEVVWTRTHRVGGPVFMVVGVLFIAAGLLNWGAMFLLWTTLAMIAFLYGYSYLVYRGLMK